MSGFFYGRPWPPAAHLIGAENSLEVFCKSAKGKRTEAMQILSALRDPGIAPAVDERQHQAQGDVRPPQRGQRRSPLRFLFRVDLVL